MRSLRKRRIVFGALAAIDAVALAATGAAIYLWILFFQGMLLLVGFIQVRMTLSAVSIKIELPEGQTESGGAVEIPIVAAIERPILPAHLTVAITTADARQNHATVYVSLPPGISRGCSLICECPYRGEYEIGAEALEATDIFGLIRMRVEGAKLRTMKARFAVTPKAYDLDQSLLDLRMNEGMEDGARSRTGEVSSIADLRDWQEGDPLVRVHWKISARVGKPIVKEFDGSYDVRNLIFVDGSRAGFPELTENEYTDRINRLDAEETVAAAAVSFCRLFCGNGRSVRLVTCGEARLETESRENGGFGDGYDALRLHLAGMQFGGDATAAQMLRFECEEYGKPDSLVFISSDVSAELSEELSSLSSGGSRVTFVCCGADLDEGSLSRMQSRGVQVQKAALIEGGERV